MSDQNNIPVLTDLIERGMEITMSDLGLDDSVDIEIDATEIDMGIPVLEAADPLKNNPALEQAIRQILDEHMELAWQEIRFAIQQHLDK
jgi:hypothetical protein